MQRIIDGLREINQEYLGAIDNTIGYVCRFEDNISAEDILSGKVKRWQWKTIPAAEAEDLEPCIMFVKHVDENPALAAILKQLRVHIVNITNLNSLPISSLPENREIRVGISGLLIDETLFVRDKFRTKESFNDFATHEDLQARRGVALDNFCLRGTFDLTLCSYYCSFK